MMDGSGGGNDDRKMSSFSKTWKLLRNPNLPWFIAYISLGCMALMMVVLWLALQDFKERVEKIKPEAFQDCVEQMERMKPDIGAKYLAITCSPDGSLKALAWSEPGDL